MSRPPRRIQAFDWSGAAAALAAVFPRDRLHPRVVQWSAGRTRAAKGPWGVAFSGGADSLALLLLVWAHWPEQRARLRVLHFNHGLRGLASAGDARFCRSVCRALNLPFFTARWRRTKSEKTPSEAQARSARFGFFSEVLSSERAGALWTGHHRDDVAESMLMRLARGSGIAGLIAPRPLHVSGYPWSHVRPLLTLSRSELRDGLVRCGISWREDESNDEGVFFRNRIRNEVIPVWVNAAHARDAVAGAALSRELLEEDAEALDAWLDDLRPLRRRTLNLVILANKPRALVRRALQQWKLSLGPDAGDLSRQGFELLLAAVEQGQPKRLSLGPNGFAVISTLDLRFVKK